MGWIQVPLEGSKKKYDFDTSSSGEKTKHQALTRKIEKKKTPETKPKQSMHTKDRSLKANKWPSSHTWMFSSSQKFPGHPLCSPPFPLLLQPKNPSLKKNPLTSKSPLFPCLSYQATTCSHVHHSANASSSPTTMGEPCSWPPVHAASSWQKRPPPLSSQKNEWKIPQSKQVA